jgi:hypothetical protein
MALPQNTTTIEEFVKSGESISISYQQLSFLYKLNNGTSLSMLNVISDYIDELCNACVNVSLTQEQQFKYFYKPKLLCSDIYGNPELYYIILLINGITDVKEFTKPVIKMLRKDHMSEIISMIYNANKNYIDTFNNDKK